MKLIKSNKFPGVYHIELKDGDLSYYVCYRDTNGKQFKQKIGKKSEGINEAYCNRIRLNTINHLKNGELPPYVQLRKKHKTITLNSVADYYFEHQSNKSTQKWLNKYNLHIRPLIGDKDIELLDIKDMEFLQKTLLEKNLALSTINCYFDIVSAVANYGLKNDIYKGKNPTKLIKNLKVDNKRERFLSVSEVADLLNCVSPYPTLYLFTKLALSVGGRLQTILNIRKRDVDLANGIITLKDFKNESTYNGYICDDELRELLRQRMELCETNDFIVWENGIKNTSRYISRKMTEVFYDLFKLRPGRVRQRLPEA